MKEFSFGDTNRHSLLIRLFSPSWNLFRSIFSRSEYDFYVSASRGNHRCWCPDGVRSNGRIEIAGWGAVYWYSYYPGRIPCACDEACCNVDLHFIDEGNECNICGKIVEVVE